MSDEPHALTAISRREGGSNTYLSSTSLAGLGSAQTYGSGGSAALPAHAGQNPMLIANLDSLESQLVQSIKTQIGVTKAKLASTEPDQWDTLYTVQLKQRVAAVESKNKEYETEFIRLKTATRMLEAEAETLRKLKRDSEAVIREQQTSVIELENKVEVMERKLEEAENALTAVRQLGASAVSGSVSRLNKVKGSMGDLSSPSRRASELGPLRGIGNRVSSKASLAVVRNGSTADLAKIPESRQTELKKSNESLKPKQKSTRELAVDDSKIWK
jgi:hypothetical protein